MKFEKQVEEMAKIIRETTFIRGFEYSAAAGIFAAGYGKVKEERLKAYKEGYEQGKFNAAIEAGKETFMEIMEMLRFGYELPIDDIAREMAKGYGVEVEND